MKESARGVVVSLVAVIGAACGAAACVGAGRLLAATYGPASWAGGLLSDWINLATCACFGAAITLLLERCTFILRQRAVPHVPALGVGDDALLTPDDVKAARQQFAALPPRGRRGLSARLLDAGLQRARAHWSAEDVSDAIKTEAELVQTRTYAEYSMIRFLIWAIPTLGFIGTVVGISLAMGVLSGTPLAGPATSQKAGAGQSPAESVGQAGGGQPGGAQQGGGQPGGAEQGGAQQGGAQGGAQQGGTQQGGTQQGGAQQGGAQQGGAQQGGAQQGGTQQGGAEQGGGKEGSGKEASGKEGSGKEGDGKAQGGKDAAGSEGADAPGVGQQGGGSTNGSPPVAAGEAGGRQDGGPQGVDGVPTGTGGAAGPSRVVTDLPGQKPPSGSPPAKRFVDVRDPLPGAPGDAAARPRDDAEMAAAQRALAMAFNTTFVALVLSLVAMFFMHRVESWEEGLLVDATRGVLRRLPLRMYIRQERLP